MLSVSNLGVRYGMHEALSSASLQVGSDEIVVILGANGAGKSTLLKAIAGNCEGTCSGEVSMDGRPIMGLEPASIVECGIAFVPEGRGIFGELSVQENLLLGAYAEHARDNQAENLDRVLALFPKLAERHGQIARTMSGGEQQMVAIGRALMSAPSILMLDEPSLGLSPLLCKELFSALRQVCDSQVGVLLVEQNARQSLGIADRGYLLENGKITGEDSAENLLHDTAVQVAYLGGAATASAASRQPTPVVEQSANTAAFRINDKSTVTASGNSLAGEDIDHLVARASSVAAIQRDQSTIAVNSLQKDSVSSRSPRTTATNSLIASSVGANAKLPATRDPQIQQLLTEFEEAAQRASNAGRQDKHRSSHRLHKRSQQDETSDQLPDIPVYRKTGVTIYRRDATGSLRKQERT